MSQEKRLQDMRIEYGKNLPLSIDSVSKNPFIQFSTWLNIAITDDRVYEALAMSISTAFKDGSISSRMVLLRECTDEGFIFFTNYLSKKGKQLTDNPKGAILFYWDKLEWQIRIEGDIERVSDEKSEYYFNHRPLGSQKASALSKQSEVLEDKDAFAKEVENVQNISRPKHWGGYILKPNCFEFWQGGKHRLHDRITYTKQPDGSWHINRLYP